MATHAEKRVVPYTPKQMYDLVADVERYPQFLPWCLGARLRSVRENVLLSDLVVGFKGIRESFTTRVTLNPDRMRIDVAYLDGPFKYLNNHWIFNETAGGSCEIDFFVDFEFRSRLLQKIMGLLFNEAVRRMVSAFEARAHDLYGRGGRARSAG